MRQRRCLLPADGFYEWKKVGPKKQPYFIHLPDDRPFALAGLWERWADRNGRPLETCTILTTDANVVLRPFHTRMPVIIEPADYTAWLDTATTEPDQFRPLFASLTSEQLIATPVSTHVNSPANDDPDCVAPAEAETTLFRSRPVAGFLCKDLVHRRPGEVEVGRALIGVGDSQEVGFAEEAAGEG